ncbi:phosphoadenosine phosphosulfate reductase family protein [Lysinibacillus sp. UGB7]|uniref:phosphoadenosine phosphosulfate reductase domain-containing protein n=1 Tax=Lysinibacillus sp. UGB7 TaxID=3411039 RepID=UPI003B760F62
MNNHVIFFSGGIASFEVAHYVKTNYPKDNILLYFTDTLWEDEDLYRFIYEVSDKLELPLLYHSRGINPIQLMFKEATVFNSRIGRCSTVLKMEVALNYFKRGLKPKIFKYRNKNYLKQEIDPLHDSFISKTILYFGIGWEEEHRKRKIALNWQPYEVKMPLIDELIDKGAALEIYNIKKPRLYDYGFAHNNCKGRCVKAGQAHYINLLQQLPELFKETMTQEFHMSRYVAASHYIRATKYLPESEVIPFDTQEILLKELNDAYADYFNGITTKPNVYVHPCITATKFETELLLIEYGFKKNRKGKWKRVKFQEMRKSKHFMKLNESNKKLKLFETRHLKPTNYSFMKKRSKGISSAYPLRNFYWDVLSEGLQNRPTMVHKQKSKQFDLFEFGGCGCFVDFSDIESSVCDVSNN